MARHDAVVLGAGIVGSSVAAHLARRGLATVLVDRRDPGEETSHGNAGLIEQSGVMPVAFPRDPLAIARVALGLMPHANYHVSALPALAPFLFAYFRQSSKANLARSGAAMWPLLERAVEAHRDLMAEAGREDLLRPGGVLKIFRTGKSFDAHMREDVPVKRGYGLKFEVLDRDAAIAKEPSLAPVFRHAVWWTDPVSSTDPGASTKAIAALAQRHGAYFVRGDARSLRRERDDWLVETVEGPVTAPVAVIALGPWSGEIAARFGARLPFAVKRGYHMHYRPRGNAALGTPLYDVDSGFYLAPMARGIRLTTGIEFARADAPPTPVQLTKTRPLADALFPLGEALDAEPWMGRRPCLPDSLPAIGRLPGQPGLIAAFGHQHLGFTMGPITGRLVADIVTGETPVVDPSPYRVERFG